MTTAHLLLRSSLIGLALIFSSAADAASLSCAASTEGYRCEAWPQGANYRYEWHAAGKTVTGTNDDSAQRRVSCLDHSTPIAVSVITPAGYIETATRLLPACAAHAGVENAALASSF